MSQRCCTEGEVDSLADAVLSAGFSAGVLHRASHAVGLRRLKNLGGPAVRILGFPVDGLCNVRDDPCVERGVVDVEAVVVPRLHHHVASSIPLWRPEEVRRLK